MDIPSTQDIWCESIPFSSGSGCFRNALFFHRFPFPEEDTNSVEHTNLPNCSIHTNLVATVQCLDCVRYCIPAKYSYHCSNNCFLDAWKYHVVYHHQANTSNRFKEDTKALGKLKRCNSWPPGDMVSLSDEKLEVVIPPGTDWIDSVGPSNPLIPFADGVGFSFKLPYNSTAAVCYKEIFVTDPMIQRRSLSPRPIIWLPDVIQPEKFDITENLSEDGKLKVLTYNILSHIYVNVNRYPYCPHWALTWEYRRDNLLLEIIQYGADVLCLQEVQSDHYENFFKPKLEYFGYSSVYKRKTKEVYTGNGYTMDGCAIFFRNDKFEEVISYELEYNKSALSLVGKLEPTLRVQAGVHLIKDNVAIAVILETKNIAAESAVSFSRFCVVNTHIYAGKGYFDVQLLQVSDLINEIEKIIDPKMPLFICGDINSSPGRVCAVNIVQPPRPSTFWFDTTSPYPLLDHGIIMSDPYILLTKGEVDPACAKAPDPLGINEHLKLHHSLKLASAYASAFLKHVNDVEVQRMIMIHPKTGEPFFTSLTPSHGSTLDYIFYTEDSLEVEGLLELLHKKSVGKALPSPLWSSDHIALMGIFRITRPFSG